MTTNAHIKSNAKTKRNVKFKTTSAHNATKKYRKTPYKHNGTVNSSTCKYIVVFDLDETIGYFQNLGLVFDEQHRKTPVISKENVMHTILDQHPNSFRLHIFSLFQYLKKRKHENKNIMVVLYTNNQGPKYWYTSIISYIHKQLNYELFDTIIGPYKIGNTQIERSRTSHNKSVIDMYNILEEDPETTKVIMFDDQHHSNMKHPNVTYIHLYKYIPFAIDDTHHKKNTYHNEFLMMKHTLKEFLPKNKTKQQKQTRSRHRVKKKYLQKRTPNRKTIKHTTKSDTRTHEKDANDTLFL